MCMSFIVGHDVAMIACVVNVFFGKKRVQLNVQPSCATSSRGAMTLRVAVEGVPGSCAEAKSWNKLSRALTTAVEAVVA